MCKLETRMMTENVKSREAKEREDEKKQKEKLASQFLFNAIYDENGTQSYNPTRG